MTSPSTRAGLTKLELRIMQVIWKRGSSTVGAVQGELQPPLAYTTVQTVLNILERKGKLQLIVSEQGRGTPGSQPALSAFLRSLGEACPGAGRVYVALDNWPVHFHEDGTIECRREGASRPGLVLEPVDGQYPGAARARARRAR